LTMFRIKPVKIALESELEHGGDEK